MTDQNSDTENKTKAKMGTKRSAKTPPVERAGKDTEQKTIPSTQNPYADSAACAVHASKIYGSGETEVRALDEIEVAFPKAQFTAIMGPSGSGKSTLMHCMAGLDTLTSGQVFIGDTDLTKLGERARTLMRRDHVGFIFQAYNLVPTLTAEENIKLPLALAGSQGDVDWIDEVIATTGLGDRLKHRPKELSGGQQQRVAVARALASRPAIIFGDEPTGNLDTNTGADLLSFMKTTVAEMGQTIVMVTHDPISASYADRVVFLVDGKIEDQLNDPTHQTIQNAIAELRT